MLTKAPHQSKFATIGYDDFIGRIAIGHILKGRSKKGTTLMPWAWQMGHIKRNVTRSGSFVDLLRFLGRQCRRHR